MRNTNEFYQTMRNSYGEYMEFQGIIRNTKEWKGILKKGEKS